jgi:hypothetical protein
MLVVDGVHIKTGRPKSRPVCFAVFEDLVELALGRGGITPAMLRGVARNWVTGN